MSPHPGQWLRPRGAHAATRREPELGSSALYFCRDKNTGKSCTAAQAAQAEWSSSGNFINGAGRLRHATRALIMRKTYDVAINLFVLLVCAVHSRVDLGLSLTLRWEPWAGNIAECCNSTEWSAHVSPHHEEKAIGRELGRGGQETGDCTEGQKPGKCRIRAWPHIDHVTASLWIWCRHRYSIYQRRYSQVGHPEKGESTWSNWLLLGKRPAWSSSMDGSGKS